MPQTVEFIYDYASPWAYLASELLERRLPGAEILYRPIYIRGLDAFKGGLPYTGPKLRYNGMDYLRCAAHEAVPTTFPSEFPINGIHALRGALFAQDEGVFPAYHRAMFHAAWRDDRPVSQKETVIAVAAEIGLDRARFAAALEEPARKELLKSATAAAIDRGVFGVPSFFVEGELFWGHDRMDYVARALTASGAA